jgi:hypothetical protein
MKPDRFEQELAEFARQPLPAPSGNLTTDVWRAIEGRRRQSIWSRMFSPPDWLDLFSEPRLVALAVAFAVVVGIFPAAVIARAENQSRLARSSIHFDVFAMDSAGSLGSVFANPVTTPRADTK